MKKERLFYLDFVRAIAALAIVLIHYNFRYLYLVPQDARKLIGPIWISNIYVGEWGVSLFFIISGAALMYVYEERCELKSFYKKRFFSIYPMFWIAYITVFFFDWITTGSHVGMGVPKKYFLLSVIGFDGLMAENIPTYYLLGEWFLGTIVCLYIIFPLLRKLLNEKPVVLFTIVAVVYIYLVFFYNGSFGEQKLIFSRLPEVVFGMCFVKYRWKVKWPVALAAFIILRVNEYFRPASFYNLQVTYIGIATFVLLVFLSYYAGKLHIVEKTCALLSKYSYAIFLTHHVIIGRIMARVDLVQISVGESRVLFVVICILIAISTAGLYWVHHFIMKGINSVTQRIVEKSGKR